MYSFIDETSLHKQMKYFIGIYKRIHLKKKSDTMLVTLV